MKMINKIVYHVTDKAKTIQIMDYFIIAETEEHYVLKSTILHSTAFLLSKQQSNQMISNPTKGFNHLVETWALESEDIDKIIKDIKIQIKANIDSILSEKEKVLEQLDSIDTIQDLYGFTK